MNFSRIKREAEDMNQRGFVVDEATQGSNHVSGFLSGHRRWRIASFQRAYVWTDNQVEGLLKALYLLNKGQYVKYNIGNIHTFLVDEVSDIVSVIDGQQRLTTLFLITKALFEIAKEQNDEDVIGILRPMLYFREADRTNSHRFEVFQKIEDEFNSIEEIPSNNTTYNVLVRNYNSITDWVKEMVNDGEDIYSFTQCLTKLFVNYTVYSNEASANHAYLALNKYATPLKPFELAKSVLYELTLTSDEYEPSDFISMWNDFDELADRILLNRKDNKYIHLLFGTRDSQKLSLQDRIMTMYLGYSEEAPMFSQNGINKRIEEVLRARISTNNSSELSKFSSFISLMKKYVDYASDRTITSEIPVETKALFRVLAEGHSKPLGKAYPMIMIKLSESFESLVINREEYASIIRNINAYCTHIFGLDIRSKDNLDGKSDTMYKKICEHLSGDSDTMVSNIISMYSI